MFQFFRRRDTLVRWFLGGLLLIVCVMLVVTLIPGLSTPSSTDDASILATVAGEPIAAAELQLQYQQIARSQRLPPGMLAMYAPQMLNQMVMEKAGQYEARRMGLMVTSTELAEELRQTPGLFPGGQFIGEERYRDMIEQRFNLSVAQFEEKYRDSLLADKLRRVVTDGISVGDQEVDREYRRRNDKVKLDYVVAKSADFTAQVQVEESGLKAFFDRNRAVYTIPEKRRLRLLLLGQGWLLGHVDVSEPEIRDFYNQNRERYRVEDKAQVSHILLKTVGKTPQQVDELEKKARELLQKARAGEDFAALAKQYSEDTGTQPKGGDLGWISRGQTVPEFEKAAFSLEQGKISDVIKTVYGFHILKVNGRIRARLPGLEEIRTQVMLELKKQKGERVKQETSDRLRAALRRNPKSLDATAMELKVPVLEVLAHQRADAFPEMGFSPPTDEALFKLKAGEVSDVVSIPQGLVAMQVEQIMAQHPAELAEMRSRLEQDYRTEKARELAIGRGRELADRARSLGDLKKAAAAFKMEMKTSEPLNRDGRIPELDSVEPAFRRKVGEISDPVPLSSGGMVYVYRVAEQIFVTPKEIAKNRESLRSELLDKKRNATFELYLENLKQRLAQQGKLKINDAALKRFSGAAQQQ